jgi:hypothetical protein
VRRPFPDVVEQGRIQDGFDGTSPGAPYGAFLLSPKPGVVLRVIANTGNRTSEWWEHVSISLVHRTPTWDEMCWIKDLFWKEEECVVQYHPPKSEYVNCHPNTLHLWRPTRSKDKMPIPPSYLVGPK